MKSWVEERVPEQYGERALQFLAAVPSIPQMPEMAPEKQSPRGEPGSQDPPVQGKVFSELSHMINVTVIGLSVAAQYTPFYDTVVFRPSAITTMDPLPQVWTLVTCNLFESTIFFLCLHLLLLNYLVGQLDHVWNRQQFAKLVIFAAFWTSLLRLATRLGLAAILDDPSA